MIVVVGQPQFRAGPAGAEVDGLSARIALAAAARGGTVQQVGKVGEDPEGDAVVLALARGGVGHVVLLRDAGMETHRSVGASDGDLEAPDDVASNAAADQGLNPGGASWEALEAADVDLALRYLSEFSVIVLSESADREVSQVVADAASWADARLIVVVPPGAPVPDALPPDAIVFEAPEHDPDGVFATMVGSFAAALDEGEEPLVAFRASVESGGWTPAQEQ